MGRYLRDQYIKFVQFDEDRLRELNRHIVSIQTEVNTHLAAPQQLTLSYVVRFDGKGYRLTSFEEVASSIRASNVTERFIITLESPLGRQTNTAVEIGLDANDNNKCTILVTCDDSERWCVDTFAGIAALLDGYKSKNWYINAPWTGLIIQLIEVAITLALGLWSTKYATRHLNIDTSAATTISFLTTLIVFGKLCDYANPYLFRYLNRTFPNIQFKPRKPLTFTWATVIGAVVALIVTVLFVSLVRNAIAMMDELIK